MTRLLSIIRNTSGTDEKIKNCAKEKDIADHIDRKQEVIATAAAVMKGDFSLPSHRYNECAASACRYRRRQ